MAVIIEPKDKTAMARELARSFPPQFRPAAGEMFATLFDAYEASYPRELAGALAVLLAGGYAAFHHRVLPESFALAALKQWQDLLGQGEKAALTAPAGDVNDTYVRSVMLGMHLLAATAKSQQAAPDSPEVASLRDAGRQALKELLKVDAERVELAEAGFRIC